MRDNRRVIKRPVFIVGFLTALNFLNYIDRMVLSAVLPKMQEELAISNFAAGMLSTVFLLGYFVTAPIFGVLADRGQRRLLIAAGVMAWSVATIATGFCNSLPTLFIARAVVGIGEASFVTLAPTIIDDITPSEKKGRTLAIFYLATPLGSALGYLLGGAVGQHASWRAAFYVAGLPGIALAVASLYVAEPARRMSENRTSFVAAGRSLWRIPMFRIAVIGYCAHTAAVGAFAFWGPKFLTAQYAMSLKGANFWFGTITVIAGAIGTLAGGRWADRALARSRATPRDGTLNHHDSAENRSAMQKLLRICAIGVGIGGLLAFAGFAAPNATLFFAAVFFIEIGIFVSTSPINAVLLRAVPNELRNSAMAISIFAIHLFGDLWSPPAVGLLADHLPMQIAMMALPVVLVAAAVLWVRTPQAQAQGD